jgi:hypothetical protein
MADWLPYLVVQAIINMFYFYGMLSFVKDILLVSLQQITSYSTITTPLKYIWVEYIQPHANVPNENHCQTIGHYV